MDAGSRAREVAISCPYWIINKTNVVLKLKDTTLNASMPVAAPPAFDRAEPVLFRWFFQILHTYLNPNKCFWPMNLFTRCACSYDNSMIHDPKCLRGKFTESLSNTWCCHAIPFLDSQALRKSAPAWISQPELVNMGEMPWGWVTDFDCLSNLILAF